MQSSLFSRNFKSNSYTKSIQEALIRVFAKLFNGRNQTFSQIGFCVSQATKEMKKNVLILLLRIFFYFFIFCCRVYRNPVWHPSQSAFTVIFIHILPLLLFPQKLATNKASNGILRLHIHNFFRLTTCLLNEKGKLLI